MSKIQWQMKSPVGPLFLVTSEKALHGVFWKKQNVPLVQTLTNSGPAFEILNKAIAQLEKYFAGTLVAFDLPIEPEGTDFQKRVWSELSKIPYGQTTSYREIAKRLNNEKAVRAVGAANGKNPISIIVPCHRVIGSNGSLTGYAGGLTAKTFLLDLEVLRT